ncbi:zinc finger CW-type PWWP domain protein 2-like [Denticeps clupeoides]|uniref:zinc finger CW-type PWWP domain protein 2-like n=1 Tax=Denticeps clupeoides TaxID=299321 RepID=UPI0010A37BA2|nr:zinc finger CW-type PWWP domain protein 2 [Denticeps clupeoides]
MGPVDGGRLCRTDPALPLGSLVVVKTPRRPWWPAILSRDPAFEEYVMYDGGGRVRMYHAELLGTPRRSVWALAQNAELYHTVSTSTNRLKCALRRSYEVAVEEAGNLRNVDCEGRLLMCHFKPLDLLSHGVKLMSEIEIMIRQCTSKQQTSNMHQESKTEDIEICDSVIIEGFKFHSATCPEHLTFA